MNPGFDETALAWTDHVRHGGTTPWARWVQSADRLSAPRADGPVPGAAQLELLRRLALRDGGTTDARAFERLADLTLLRSPPARGLPRRPLSWPGDRPPVGAPPIDPADVPVEELVRVGVGVLAELLVLAPAHPPAPPPSRSPLRAVRRRQRGPAFRLVGAPVTTAAVRAALAAAGHVEGGRRPLVVVLARPLDAQLAEVWSARVQGGAATRWAAFVSRWAHRDDLPPRADVARVADRWADRVGPDRVRVVLAPADPGRARTVTASVLELADPPAPARPDLLRLPPAAVDVLRRLNRVLAVRVGEEGHRLLLRQVSSLLDEGRGPLPVVPEQHAAWLQARATGVAERLADAGYAVHGDPGRIVPRERRGRAGPRRNEVLDLVSGLCLALARQQRHAEVEGRAR